MVDKFTNNYNDETISEMVKRHKNEDAMAAISDKPNYIDKVPHYNTGKIEVIDFVEDQDLNFSRANCIKYVCRAGHKGNEIEDLEKAKWYIEREINRLK